MGSPCDLLLFIVLKLPTNFFIFCERFEVVTLQILGPIQSPRFISMVDRFCVGPLKVHSQKGPPFKVQATW